MILSEIFRPTNFKRALFFLLGDVVISFFTLYLAYLLRFNFIIPKEYVESLFKIFPVIAGLKLFFYFIFKLYFVSWRFFSLPELKKLILATTLAYLSFFVIFYLFRDFFIPMPRSALIIDYFLSLLFIGLFRISKRLVVKHVKNVKEAVIIGANEKTLSLLKQNIPYEIKGVYDDGALVGSYIYGYKVLPLSEIEEIDTVIITKELPQEELNRLVDFLKEKNISDIKIYTPFEKKIKDISIEDLLARKPKDLDKEAIENFVKNRKIMVTGAGGSIGSEICRICEKYGAKELILIENSEYNLYSINEELQIKRKPYLIDVTKYEEIKRVFEKEKPEIVIHAAAYKHVPLCEENPRSAVINNVIGTKNVIDLSIENEAENFILISTDKAVRPTNVMGATKRLCELYAQNVDSKNTKVAAVRFGNVLGSSGSVVPKFKKLIEENKPLSVTHPEITRYFMLIPEACQLVLQAGSLAKNGEIFILDMGKPVKIVDLAKKMLKLYGKDENNIIYTGLRPGEKLYEELLINEAEKETRYESIFVAKPTKMDIKKLNQKIDELSKLLRKEEIIKKLKEIVKEYTPSPH
ncbi:MAG: nucleoside-diphosphate sugar epimerase/dehydratase [Nautiliaceae bacterium]